MGSKAWAAAFLVLLLAAGASPAFGWEHPVVKGAGRMISLPGAAAQPDPELDYRIVFDVTKWENLETQPVPGLFKVARLINVYASAGMPPPRLDLVLVMHGWATEAAIAPEPFKKRYGFANPNVQLISRLAELGVTLYVCGQALKEHEIEPGDVHPDIEVALSALTVVPTFQLKGYAAMAF
jgi:intracellular sulfur oxidation DsrE/DsrF family protein